MARSDVPPEAHTCRYDRVNTGASSKDASRHHIADSVGELRGFLDQADVSPPYVLVGHSLGGLISMMYAAEYPDEVSGLLLVEGLMPFEHELDVSVSTPAELKALKKELDNNAERLWRYDADAKADPRLAERLPDVPVTYMFGTRQTLPAEWPSGAYLAKLKAIIGSLDDGRLVDVAAGHGIPVEAPDEVTAQLQRFL